MLEECRSIQERALGKDHPHYVVTVKRIEAWKARGKSQEAGRLPSL